MPFDALSHGELADSHEYEKKVLKYTYYCNSCRRSFVSPDETEKCKFCNSSVELMKDELFNKIIKNVKFHYYCDFCKKDYIVFHKPLRCVCEKPIKKLNRIDKKTFTERVYEIIPALGAAREKRLANRVERTAKRKFSLPKIYLKKKKHGEETPTD
jgi:hypothetical protein